MKSIRKEGWQVWVDVYDDYVIKTPKTKKEIKQHIWKYLISEGGITKLNEKTKALIDDIKKSRKIIEKSKIPKRYLAYPEFLEGDKIKQRRVNTIQNELNKMYEKGEISEAKKIIDNFFKFIYKIWEYGVHEKPIKFNINFGIINKEIVLIDLFELTDDKKKIEGRINNKSWKNDIRFYSRHVPKELVDYYLKQADKKLTIKALNKHWKKKIK